MSNSNNLVVNKKCDRELVYIENNKIFTDSRTIAEVFGKGHDKVLRDIRELKCSEKFRQANFGESTYINKQNKKMPCYILTENGFAMVAMGYTGNKAIQFKERYIEEFDRMRQVLESGKFTLLSQEQRQIQKVVRQVIHELFPRMSDGARRKYFARLYRDLKARYSVPSFRDIRRCDFEEALHFINSWHSPKLESGDMSNKKLQERQLLQQ